MACLDPTSLCHGPESWADMRLILWVFFLVGSQSQTAWGPVPRQSGIRPLCLVVWLLPAGSRSRADPFSGQEPSHSDLRLPVSSDSQHQTVTLIGDSFM